MQFPAWLFLSLFAFTYLLSCALKLNDDDDDDDDDVGHDGATENAGLENVASESRVCQIFCNEVVKGCTAGVYSGDGRQSGVMMHL